MCHSTIGYNWIKKNLWEIPGFVNSELGAKAKQFPIGSSSHHIASIHLDQGWFKMGQAKINTTGIEYYCYNTFIHVHDFYFVLFDYFDSL